MKTENENALVLFQVRLPLGLVTAIKEKAETEQRTIQITAERIVRKGLDQPSSK